MLVCLDTLVFSRVLRRGQGSNGRGQIAEFGSDFATLLSCLQKPARNCVPNAHRSRLHVQVSFALLCAARQAIERDTYNWSCGR